MKPRNLALVQGILGKFLRKTYQNRLPFLDAAVAKLPNGKHEASEWGKIVSLFSGELQQPHTLALAGTCACHAKNPANGRGLKAEHIVLDAHRQIRVVEGGIEGESLFGILAGHLAELKAP